MFPTEFTGFRNYFGNRVQGLGKMVFPTEFLGLGNISCMIEWTWVPY